MAVSKKGALREEVVDCPVRSTSVLWGVLCVTCIDPRCLSPASFQKFSGASQGREAPVGPGSWVTADGLEAQLGVPRIMVQLWVP